MDIINKNPYRYLGVYSNSPTKERVANKGKMNAFLKVGKPVSFPLDLPQLLSPIDRKLESVADAESRLTLPVDQIRYAQFWWMNATPLDGIAFNHLFEGNADKAKDIWDKKDNLSSLQNRIVLALIQGNIPVAIQCAQSLYTNYSEEFVQNVIGDDFKADAPLWQIFFDSLFNSGINAQAISDSITVSEWKTYISQKTVAPLIDRISSAIATSKASKGKGPDARLKAGQKLMSETKSVLAQLKKLLPTTDIRYQTIADKLATEILQCGIDYYNDSDDDDCAEKGMKLQKYAYTIAVGSMTKGRCKENVDILQKAIDSLPPSQVMKQYREVQNELAKFRRLPDRICHAIDLLNSTKEPLSAMKAVIGSTHSAYLKLSTQVVNNALHNVIEEVNYAQSRDKALLAFGDVAVLQRVRDVLEKAWEATLLMDTFDMEAEFKSNRYAENRRILKNMCDRLEVPTYSSSSSTSNKSRSGCIAALVVGVIISGIGAAVGGAAGAFVGVIVGIRIGLIIYEKMTD